MTIKRKRIYEIIIISLVLMFTSLCAYMGITAVQKSMKLNLSFNVEPAILCQIDIKASGADDSTYKTIFNNVSSVIAENVSLSGNSLILSQTFLNAYKTSLGASVVLKITNLLDNDGIKVTTTASDGVNATSEVVMQKKGANGSAEIEVNVTNAGTLTLSYEICNEVTYNITYNNIVCVDATADNSANPTTYKNTDAAFLLIEPTKTGCEFLGWTYAGQTEPTKSVSIPQGTTGDLIFTANWGATLPNPSAFIDFVTSNVDYSQTPVPDEIGEYETDYEISSIIFAKWGESGANIENSAYSTGLNIDASSAGAIKFFYDQDTDNVYILSPNTILANQNCNGMFWVMGARKNFPLSNILFDNFNTSKVTDMDYMFCSCDDLTSLDLSSFDTSNVTSMLSMFSGCSGLTSLELSNFGTSSVTNMSDMFRGCTALKSLDVSNFDTSNVSDMSSMFENCSNLKTIYASDKWSTASVTSSDAMFTYCTSLVGGDGVTKVTSTNKTNAHCNAGGY